MAINALDDLGATGGGIVDRVERAILAAVADAVAEVRGYGDNLDQGELRARVDRARKHLKETKTNSAIRARSEVIAAMAARLDAAVAVCIRYGGIDGEHHKTWVIDQVLRVLLTDQYDRVIAESCAGEDGPNTWGHDVGVAP